MKEYSISDIIISSSEKKQYYVGTFEDAKEGEIDWPHRHNFYSIVWFTDSIGVNVIDLEEYEIKPNRLFLMQPLQIHNWSYSKKSKGFTLVIEKYLIPKEVIDLFQTVCIDLPLTSIFELKSLFQNLISEFQKEDSLSYDIVLSGVTYLINRLKRFSLDNNDHKIIKTQTALAFSRLVCELLSKNLSVYEYAQKLNLTPQKLTEVCQDNFGQSPKAIILDKKMIEAKRLLYFTDYSVNQVAYKLGFEDSSYFSRLFKQKTKLTPTEFKSTR